MKYDHLTSYAFELRQTLNGAQAERETIRRALHDGMKKPITKETAQ